MLHLVVCMFGNVIVNTSTAVIIHFLCFKCTIISNKSAAFQSLLLDAMNVANEYIIIFIPYLGISPDNIVSMTPIQYFILTLASKVLYCIGIMAISQVFCKRQRNTQHISAGLMTISIFTVVIILLIIKVNTTSNLLSVVCFMLIIMNIIVFAINQKQKKQN